MTDKIVSAPRPALGVASGLEARRQMAENTARLRDAIRKESGILPDSTVAIREDRDTRGCPSP